MKRTLLLTLIACGCFYASVGQDQTTNLKKYWDYRERLRQKFVVVSENIEREGVNIPAARINHTDRVVAFSDGNFGMNHYISMLSTELWLLKQNGQDYSKTLKELYYAMLAMERLDLYSEWQLRNKYHIYLPGGSHPFMDPYDDINGFHIRDDVSDNFWNTYSAHFCPPGTTFDCSSVYIGNPTNGTMEEMSQDNIYHNLEALALVAQLVGTESVAGIPVTFEVTDILTDQLVIPQYLTKQGIMNGNLINFSAWAKDYVKRYLHYVQNYYSIMFTINDPLDVFHISVTNYWYIANAVIGGLVQQGSGSDFDTGVFYNAGLVAAGNSITGENTRDHDAFILNNGESLDLFNNLFSHGGEAGVTIHWPLSNKALFIPFKTFDDYKIRSLATTGNTAGDNTLAVLRQVRDNTTQPYEHFPLMYTALHDTSLSVGSDDYVYDRGLIENLINTAPEGGPTTKGPTAWTADSRLIWPEGLGQESDKDIELSGLDYMILHNLFYIGLRGEDFKNIGIDRNTDLSVEYVRGRNIIFHDSRTLTGKNEYHASESITITPGTKILSGATFRGIIDKRPGEYDGTLYKLPDADGGRIAGQSTDASIYKKPEIIMGDATPVSTQLTVKITTDNQSDDEPVSMYPNPAKDKINIVVNGERNETFMVRLLTIDGLQVKTTTSEESHTTMDVSDLPNGVYILTISTPTGEVVRKISVLH